jgi:hypothetical protein
MMQQQQQRQQNQGNALQQNAGPHQRVRPAGASASCDAHHAGAQDPKDAEHYHGQKDCKN